MINKKYEDIIKELKGEPVYKTIRLTTEQLTKVVNRAIEITICTICKTGIIRENYEHLNESAVLNLVDMTLNPEKEDEIDE